MVAHSAAPAPQTVVLAEIEPGIIHPARGALIGRRTHHLVDVAGTEVDDFVFHQSMRSSQRAGLAFALPTTHTFCFVDFIHAFVPVRTIQPSFFLVGQRVGRLLFSSIFYRWQSSENKIQIHSTFCYVRMYIRPLVRVHMYHCLYLSLLLSKPVTPL